jgi:hypothetical protein
MHHNQRFAVVAIAISLAFIVVCSAPSEENLAIDLRRIDRSEWMKDSIGGILEKRYQTPRGLVTITRSKVEGSKFLGAIVTLEHNVIARARVLDAQQQGVQIEETQFAEHNLTKPAYMGRVGFNSFRDRVISSTAVTGVKQYEVFVDWKW